MEFKQTQAALTVKGITYWWWLGLLTFGVLIVWDILSYQKTKLVLGDKSVTFYTGILTVNSRDIPYRNISNINVTRGLLGRSFGYGHVQIKASNISDAIIFKYVDNPEAVRLAIQDKINNA